MGHNTNNNNNNKMKYSNDEIKTSSGGRHRLLGLFLFAYVFSIYCFQHVHAETRLGTTTRKLAFFFKIFFPTMLINVIIRQ